jgi:mRNA-degrading endonuclease HigB of HigAB toxin-antitoxin module
MRILLTILQKARSVAKAKRKTAAESVVFNVKGNGYRLVVAINDHFKVLLIMWVGTHKIRQYRCGRSEV